MIPASFWSLADKVSEIPFMKDLLTHKSVEEINTKLKPNLPLIFKICGILAIVFGVLGITTLIGFGAVFGGIFAAQIVMICLIGIVVIAINILQGVGFLKLARWTPSLSVVSFCAIVLQTLLGWGGYASGGGIVSLVIDFAFLLLVLKNREMFSSIVSQKPNL